MAEANKNTKLKNRTKSGKKATRVNARRRVINIRKSRAVKTADRSIQKLVEAKKMKDAAKMLPEAYAAIDKAIKTGVLNKNTGARMKSRIARSVSVK